MTQEVVSTSPEIMGGTPVFQGTRVPVQTLLDYIEAGDTIDEFLRGFPTVTREHVVAFLERAEERVKRGEGSSPPLSRKRADCRAPPDSEVLPAAKSETRAAATEVPIPRRT